MFFVFQIQRVQNLTLYRQYMALKAQMKKRVKDCEMSALWHGTKEKCVDGILRFGFNRSYSGDSKRERNIDCCPKRLILTNLFGHNMFLNLNFLITYLLFGFIWILDSKTVAVFLFSVFNIHLGMLRFAQSE